MEAIQTGQVRESTETCQIRNHYERCCHCCGKLQIFGWVCRFRHLSVCKRMQTQLFEAASVSIAHTLPQNL